MALSHILVVSNLEQARTFYVDVLGATLYREYGGATCVVSFQGSWLVIVTSGEPSKDKPDITFTPPKNPNAVSHSMTIRAPDCQSAYETLKSRGAKFITPPINWGHEIRCFFTDPDGHLLEISEAFNEDSL